MKINKTLIQKLIIIAILTFGLFGALSFYSKSPKESIDKLTDNTSVAKGIGISKEELELCSKYIGSTPAPAETICLMDGFKGYETTSDILVWSYNFSKWDEPKGYGDTTINILIVPGSEDFNNYYPIVVKCP